MAKRIPNAIQKILDRNDQIAVLGSDDAQTVSDRPVAKKSSAELAFELEYLEPRLEEGVSVLWLEQPSIRMVGQTYTPDYMELSAEGVINFIEVKGSFRLGSEDRASVKIRWATSVHGNDRIRFLWARKDKAGRWKMRVVKAERAKVK